MPSSRKQITEIKGEGKIAGKRLVYYLICITCSLENDAFCPALRHGFLTLLCYIDSRIFFFFFFFYL